MRILGRVHSAQLKLADLHFLCSFPILEGRALDLLFGLDMLKAHQACVDLKKNVLRIQGREVESFLAKRELPDKARNPEAEAEAAAPAASGITSGSGAPSGHSSFPGAGRTLGAAPTPTGTGSCVAASGERAYRGQDWDGGGLGSTREHAIALLDAAVGNVDVAASLLFQ